MTTGARRFVSSPTFNPMPYGLMSVADMRPAVDHWQNGIEWEDYCGSAGATTYNLCNASAPAASGRANSKSDNAGLVRYGATPFTVYTEVDCAPIDFYERANDVATAALARVENYRVEEAFYSGTVDSTADIVLPHLASDAAITDGDVILQRQAVTVTGVAVDVINGLAALEAALASCYMGTGVIHVPQYLAPVLTSYNLIVRDGARYRTVNGNLVAIGAGYSGASPSGVASDDMTNMWMYATGPVFVYRDAPRLLNTDNAGVVRSTNLIKAIAERTYLIGYTCCLYAVNVITRLPEFSYDTPIS